LDGFTSRWQIPTECRYASARRSCGARRGGSQRLATLRRGQDRRRIEEALEGAGGLRLGRGVRAAPEARFDAQLWAKRHGTGRREGGGGAGTCLPGVDFGEIERERLAWADAACGVEVAARLRTGARSCLRESVTGTRMSTRREDSSAEVGLRAWLLMSRLRFVGRYSITCTHPRVGARAGCA